MPEQMFRLLLQEAQTMVGEGPGFETGPSQAGAAAALKARQSEEYVGMTAELPFRDNNGPCILPWAHYRQLHTRGEMLLNSDL